jgi:hypothetical protein
MTKLSRMSYIVSLAILVSACATNSVKLSDLKAIEYLNAKKPGGTIIVLPGEIKTSNNEFSSKYTAENIADFGEIELARANFDVLERKTRTAALSGLRSAIETGDAEYVKNNPANFTEARWIVKFDVLKAEPVSETRNSFSGETAGKIIGFLLEGAGAVVPYMSALSNSSKAVASASTSMGKYYTGLVSNVAGGVGKNVAETAGASIHSSSASSVWIVGIRYKVLDPTTTKQVATGYVEQKMEIQEVGASGPVSDSSTTYHAGVDSIIQRIVQMHVKEIDGKFK